jgi:hypothetical protein
LLQQGEQQGELDLELTEHSIQLTTIALSSPEAAAPAAQPLRRRLAEALLARGLLKVMADLREWGNAVLTGDIDRLKGLVMEVLAPPPTHREREEAAAAAQAALPAAAAADAAGQQQQQQQQQPSAAPAAPPLPPPARPGAALQLPACLPASCIHGCILSC